MASLTLYQEGILFIVTVVINCIAILFASHLLISYIIQQKKQHGYFLSHYSLFVSVIALALIGQLALVAHQCTVKYANGSYTIVFSILHVLLHYLAMVLVFYTTLERFCHFKFYSMKIAYFVTFLFVLLAIAGTIVVVCRYHGWVFDTVVLFFNIFIFVVDTLLNIWLLHSAMSKFISRKHAWSLPNVSKSVHSQDDTLAHSIHTGTHDLPSFPTLEQDYKKGNDGYTTLKQDLVSPSLSNYLTLRRKLILYFISLLLVDLAVISVYIISRVVYDEDVFKAMGCALSVFHIWICLRLLEFFVNGVFEHVNQDKKVSNNSHHPFTNEVHLMQGDQSVTLYSLPPLEFQESSMASLDYPN